MNENQLQNVRDQVIYLLNSMGEKEPIDADIKSVIKAVLETIYKAYLQQSVSIKNEEQDAEYDIDIEIDDVNDVTSEPIPFKADNNIYGQVTQENTKDESFLIRELMYICKNLK